MSKDIQKEMAVRTFDSWCEGKISVETHESVLRKALQVIFRSNVNIEEELEKESLYQHGH